MISTSDINDPSVNPFDAFKITMISHARSHTWKEFFTLDQEVQLTQAGVQQVKGGKHTHDIV